MLIDFRSMSMPRSDTFLYSTFMFAGHDTTSSALSRTLHNLVLHPEVQEKLREEITSSGILLGNVAFEDLMTLPYLDAICKETLRV